MPADRPRWSASEEERFDHRCARCSKRIRRYFDAWQGYDGLFTCFTGDKPDRGDVERRHVPADGAG